jgi:hypothetical protein
MTIHGWGTPIYASEVNIELGRAWNQGFNLNDTAVRNLNGAPSGIIYFSNFYGKSNIQPITLSIDDTNNTATSTVGGTVSTNPTAVSGGGSGGYVYAWSFVSNPNGFGLTSTNSQACRVSKNYTKYAQWQSSAVVQCTVTDNGGRAITKSANVYLTVETGM